SRGGIYREEGLDIAALNAHKRAEGTVVGFAATRTITNEQLLALDCDILIPAALEGQIRQDNADSVRARLVAEAANGPTTPAADRILFARGIPVLPDILANSGGVCVSYYEWVQNCENEQWDVDEVNQKLRTKMERAVDAVIGKQDVLNHAAGQPNSRKRAKQRSGPNGAAVKLGPADLRTAALVVAIERVATVAL